jgi:tRNA A-37 threonylcarbamoyl transferase component Bud32
VPQGDPSDGDALLGQKALELGLITSKQLNELLQEQARLQGKGEEAPTLGYLLVSRGLVPEQQLVSLMWEDELSRSDSEIKDFISSFDAPAEDKKAGSTRRIPLVTEADVQGTPFGKYRLLREVGRGGMAVVYEAKDTALDRRVALKMLLPSSRVDPEEAKIDEDRFVREAKLTANLPAHGGIVGVYETDVIDGKRYIAMEFIDGREMALWWRKSYASLRLQVRVLRDVALAVHHAHQHGLIHRDLKPANILVDSQNKPHVTDFGLARGMRRNTEHSITADDRVVGTPHYMSPEQAEGRKNVDRRTDVWALGVMLYQILTGRAPFRGATAMEVMVKAARDPVVPPSQAKAKGLRAKPDRTLEAICLRALQKAPKDRPGTAKDFAAELSAWLKGQGDGGGMRAYRAFAATGIAAGVVAVLLIVLLASGVFSSPEPVPAPPPPRPRPPVGAAPAPGPAPAPAPPAPEPARAVRLEAEKLRPMPPVKGSVRVQRGPIWQDGAQLFWTGGTPGQKLRLEVMAPRPGPAQLSVRLSRAQDYGRFKIFLNDAELASDVDLYHPTVEAGPELKFTVQLLAGANELAFHVQGSNPKASPATADSDLFQLGVDWVELRY